MTNRTKVLFLFLAMLGAISVRAYAQQKTSEKISPKERWAFETNAMDWLLLLPNAKVEFDLSSSTDNRWVVGIGAKWNGNAKISMNERIQMKINDYRLEVKRYDKRPAVAANGFQGNGLSHQISLSRYYGYGNRPIPVSARSAENTPAPHG